MAQRPFDHADPERIVCRFDVSSVFDEEDDADVDDADIADADIDDGDGTGGGTAGRARA